MRCKYILIVLSVVAVLAAAGLAVSAGDPDNPPGPPETTYSYGLEEIYDRLATGASGAQSTFTEPDDGPSTGTMHTLNDIMSVAPTVDDADGAAQADILAGKTAWGLTSGAWGVITGTGPYAPVPKTGQTTSYATGDDGDLQMGVEWPVPRFVTGTTGVVTDTLTGLIWLENANCWGTQNWATALTNANGLASGSCGLTDGSSAGDWRLPNVRELQSLIDYGEYNPALPDGHPFTGVQLIHYWSSTTLARDTDDAFHVRLDSGSVSYATKTIDIYYVWPVRGGQ
jgi:hypothetical protein